MKTTLHRIRLLLLLTMLSATAAAQTDLAVGNIFRKYGKAKGCKMVTLYDGRLKGYALKVYKSLTYSKNGNDIEQMLGDDRKWARKIREIVVDGQVTSGYYMMKPLKEGTNRFILFRRSSAGNGAVIYIEGDVKPDDIMKLCKK